jgi:5-(carboxyamino)imidazole ribonucleotide synthase
MGYRVHVFSPDQDTPAGQVADREYVGSYADQPAVARFAQSVDAVTLEFENVPVEALRTAAEHVPVRPSAEVLHTTQHRWREKTFLASHGLAVTPFQAVRSADELQAAVDASGLPGVLKTCAWGYDGKGQVVIRDAGNVGEAWAKLATDDAILEQFVDFKCELSVVAARGSDGQCVAYAPVLNDHRNHILDLSICPAPVDPRVADQAIRMARDVLDKLDHVGVLCVEFFLTADDCLLINELAPRPHNSGHLTIDAHATCQFEQQVRATCGLPLGATTQLSPAAMANLLGDLWFPQTPRWERVCGLADVKLHLYGKHEPRKGRKMGHLTALAKTTEAAAEMARRARAIAAVESTAPAKTRK